MHDEWIKLSDIVKGDVITVKGIDRTSDGLLVVRVAKEGDDIHVCFSGGLNYRLSASTRVKRWP